MPQALLLPVLRLSLRWAGAASALLLVDSLAVRLLSLRLAMLAGHLLRLLLLVQSCNLRLLLTGRLLRLLLLMPRHLLL